MVHAAMLRSPHAHARIKRIDAEAAKAAAGVLAVYVGERRQHGPQGRPLRVASAEREPQDRGLRSHLHPDRPLRRRHRRRRRRRDALSGVRRARSDRGRLRAAAVGDRSGARAQAGAPQLHADVPNNEAFHWIVAGGDVDAAFKNAEVVDQGADRSAAPHPECDGAARGAGAVERRVGRADAVEHDAEPAHPPVPQLGRHRRPRGQAAGDRAGGRRRLRQQDRRVSGRLHHRVLRDEAQAAGQVDRDAERELPGHDPRPRSRPGSRARRQEGRHDSRAARHVLVRNGRVSLDCRARHPDHPARPDAVGRLQHPGDQGRRLRRLHQRDAGRSVPRRRTARSDVHDRTDGGQAGEDDRGRSGRRAAEEHDPALRQRPHRRSPA